MLKLYSLVLVICLILIGCKSDNQETTVTETEEKTEKVDKSLQLLKTIKSAHNAQKFNSEQHVKFKLKLELKDSAFFDGYVTLKTDRSQVRFLDSNIDKIVDANSLKTELDKKLFMIAEIYSMGFWFDAEKFHKISENDSLNISEYNSVKSKSKYKVYSHSITNVIQYIDFETDISDEPFNSGSLYYEKYITVNRVPVALKWKIEVDQKQLATAEISRISYPDTF